MHIERTKKLPGSSSEKCFLHRLGWKHKYFFLASDIFYIHCLMLTKTSLPVLTKKGLFQFYCLHFPWLSASIAHHRSLLYMKSPSCVFVPSAFSLNSILILKMVAANFLRRSIRTNKQSLGSNSISSHEPR